MGKRKKKAKMVGGGGGISRKFFGEVRGVLDVPYSRKVSRIKNDHRNKRKKKGCQKKRSCHRVTEDRMPREEKKERRKNSGTFDEEIVARFP